MNNIHCPKCKGTKVIKWGKRNGVNPATGRRVRMQRLQCQSLKCSHVWDRPIGGK